jgi:hypothetical protein
LPKSGVLGYANFVGFGKLSPTKAVVHSIFCARLATIPYI